MAGHMLRGVSVHSTLSLDSCCACSCSSHALLANSGLNWCVSICTFKQSFAALLGPQQICQARVNNSRFKVFGLKA